MAWRLDRAAHPSPRAGPRRDHPGPGFRPSPSPGACDPTGFFAMRRDARPLGASRRMRQAATQQGPGRSHGGLVCTSGQAVRRSVWGTAGQPAPRGNIQARCLGHGSLELWSIGRGDGTMQLRAILVAASFAATVEASVPTQLLAQATPQPGLEPAPSAIEGKIEHKPLERTPRGGAIVIRAQVKEPARLFAPLVFARTAGSQRYGAYTMTDRGNRGFVVRLPSAILEEGSFEYFIEARHDEGEATRFGSPTRPFICVAFDPPPRPVKATFRTDEPGATLKVDDNEAGKTPVTVALGPGPHVIQVIAPDGRSTEQQIDVKPGRKLDMVVPLPSRAGGPASLGVTSDPAGARVFLDGAAVGVTPYSIELSPGAPPRPLGLARRPRPEGRNSPRHGPGVP